MALTAGKIADGLGLLISGGELAELIAKAAGQAESGQQPSISLGELLALGGAGQDPTAAADAAMAAAAATPQPVRYDPLILDLDGDGIETTAVNRYGAHFDLDANGFAESVGWVSSDDGILVRDLNGDGVIGDGTELFGDHTKLKNGQTAANGYAALADLDDNGDGKVDANDAAFSSLRVWRDLDNDGVTDAGELVTLESVGITAINTGATTTGTTDASGNTQSSTGTYVKADGTTGQTGNYNFTRDVVHSYATTTVDVPDDLLALPNLAGSGNVADLYQAMAKDSTGEIKGLVESFIASKDSGERTAIVSQLLMAWAGTEDIDATSRNSQGAGFDARKLTALERFLAQPYVGSNGSSDPIAAAVTSLTTSWNSLVANVRAELSLKTTLWDYFDNIYQVTKADGSTYWDLSGVTTMLQAKYAVSTAEGDWWLDEFVNTFGTLGLKSESNYSDFYNALHTESDYAKFVFETAGKTRISLTLDTPDYNGTTGDDIIVGTSCNNTINGNTGDDVIYGGAGDDTITGGGGADHLYGGDGNDTITDQNTGVNTLCGGAGNDTITFSEYTSNVIDGGADNDLIKMRNSNYSDATFVNTIIGGTGNDTISSGASRDTYVFSRGDGQDTISDYGYNGNSVRVGQDTLAFGAGIAASDLFLSRVGNNLVIKVNDPNNPAATDQVTVQNWFNGTTQYRIESITFADGTSLTSDQLTAQGNIVFGTEGNDTLTGGSQDDVFHGGDGSDTITDSGGNDTIDGGAGNDTITDQNTGVNTLCGGAGNDTITFSEYTSNVIDGGEDNDLIKMRNSNYSDATFVNTIIGGTGNDTISSGASRDTYIFNRGDGQDTISDYGYNGNSVRVGQDTLAFGAGITADDLLQSRVDNDLVIKINDPDNPAATDQITVQNWFNGTTQYRIESITFADGTSLTSDQLTAQGNIVFGTEGNDTLAGGSQDDVFHGSDGSDTITDSGGNDTLHGDAGNDTIRDYYGDDSIYGGEGNDIIEYGYSMNNTLDGGSGDDRISVTSNIQYGSAAYANTIIGGTGNDTGVAPAKPDILLLLTSG